MEEADVFLIGAKAHDAFDAGAVVPGAVKDDNFALRWQLFHIALEVPLALLTGVRGGQRLDAARTWVEVLGDALDSRAFAGGVAAFHDDDDAGPGFNDPLLHVHEFCLKALEFLLVGLLVEFLRGFTALCAHCLSLTAVDSRGENCTALVGVRIWAQSKSRYSLDRSLVRRKKLYWKYAPSPQ